MRKTFLVISIFWILYGCQSNVIYEKDIPVNTLGWSLTDTLNYQFNIKDTLQPYDVFVNIRHRDIYPYMNIYIQVFSLSPSNLTRNEVISLPLADDGGTWYGQCTGDVCYQRVQIMKNVRFDVPGDYLFKINQEMRLNNLNGILDMGLRIEKHQKRVNSEEN